MTSRERLLAAWNGTAADHAPLTPWCFGLRAPEHLRWTTDDLERRFWYSLRMEHIHTLPQPWTLDDDFRRVLAWQKLGVDDLLDVSVPWSVDPEVTWTDAKRSAGTMDPRYPVLIRDYRTPSGELRHAVRRTGENPGQGWVVQPDHVPLFEDFNIPRAVRHAVTGPEDIPTIRHLYRPPDAAARAAFQERMDKVKPFADDHSVAVQAWSAFGMDAAVWLAGTEGSILLAIAEPEAFARLMEIIAETDLARTELAASTPGVDLIAMRGWYSSTDFWSPKLFDQHVYPHVASIARVAHRHGKKLAYVMTTGVQVLGPRLADADVDLLCFIDPVQDKMTVERARELLGGRMTLAGGVSALTLQSADASLIRDEVRRALDVLGPTRRFILHPVDALFPDTPWRGVETLIRAWEEYR